MILSDTSIKEALSKGTLIIDPDPDQGRSNLFDRSSLDLRLGGSLRVPKEDLAITIDPASGNPSATLATLYDAIEIPPEGFVLETGRLVLGITKERIKLPLPQEFDPKITEESCLAARVEGKSSLARFGLLVHFTAPTIHAGFEGNITLEIMNLGPSSIVLRQEQPICQLILELVHGVPGGEPSQFAGQSDAAGTKI